jgi:hypothetical protein
MAGRQAVRVHHALGTAQTPARGEAVDPVRRGLLMSGAAASLGIVSGVSWAEPQSSAALGNPVIRRSSGRYVFLGGEGRQQVGAEEWRLLVYGDGGRTMISSRSDYLKQSELTTFVQVDRRFRPVEVFASYRTAGGYQGSASFRIDGDRLTGIVEGPSGRLSQETVIPDHVSIVAHPLSTDGWHTWYVDEHVTGLQSGKAINLVLPTDQTGSMVMRVDDIAWEYAGQESVEVPAGKFMAGHYRWAGADLWESGPDKILLRLAFPPPGGEFLLTEYVTS